MAFKLTGADRDRKEDLVKRLGEAHSKLEDAVSQFNSTIEEAKSKVESVLKEYNEIVGEARSFAEDVANEGQSAYDDKSERWTEGERGQAAQSWIDEWESVSLDDHELTFPDELDFGSPSHGDDLEALADELEV